MEKTKTFLECRFRQDQYDLLERLAEQFGRNLKQMFGPKGNRYASPDNEGYVSYLVIANPVMPQHQSQVAKREVVLPNGLVRLKNFEYNCDSSLSELTIPEDYQKIESIQCNHNSSLRRLTLPKDLSQLRVLSCFGNQLTELDLSTAVNLEDLHIGYTNLSQVHLPTDMSKLRRVLYQGSNQLPEEVLKQLRRFH